MIVLIKKILPVFVFNLLVMMNFESVCASEFSGEDGVEFVIADDNDPNLEEVTFAEKAGESGADCSNLLDTKDCAANQQCHWVSGSIYGGTCEVNSACHHYKDIKSCNLLPPLLGMNRCYYDDAMGCVETEN
jgi:hypothetical protein